MKIVAISGGNNSNIRKNGEPQIYEHEAIDKEIIRLTGKEHPNVLFISHAGEEAEEFASYKKIINTYGFMFNCNVNLLTINMLKDSKLANTLTEWADIIYVGGGNTRRMINLWRQYQYDETLKKACLDGKVLCGISAGANCWFTHSCSDYLQMELNDPFAPFALTDGICLVDLIFNPHANYRGRLEGIKDILKTMPQTGISLSNNMALEIVDGEYKIIEGISSENEEQFALRSYWENEEYHSEPIPSKGLVKDLSLKK